MSNNVNNSTILNHQSICSFKRSQIFQILLRREYSDFKFKDNSYQSQHTRAEQDSLTSFNSIHNYFPSNKITGLSQVLLARGPLEAEALEDLASRARKDENRRVQTHFLVHPS